MGFIIISYINMMYFDHISPITLSCPSLLYDTFSFSNQLLLYLHVFLFLSFIGFLTGSWWRAYLQHPTGVYSTKDNVSPTAIISFLLVPQWGVLGLYEWTLTVLIFCMSCASNYSFCEFMGAMATPFPEDNIVQHSTPSSSSSFPPFLLRPLRFGGRNIDVLYIAEHSTAMDAHHFDWLWVSVGIKPTAWRTFSDQNWLQH